MTMQAGMPPKECVKWLCVCVCVCVCVRACVRAGVRAGVRACALCVRTIGKHVNWGILKWWCHKQE